MASAVTTAIDALTAVVKEGIDNSKIINTLDKEISRALGLLVDLILLPFLPILIYGIITLYMAILAFGKWWNDVTSIIKKEGLLGLIKLSLLGAWDGITGIVRAILDYLFGPGEKKPLDLMISAMVSGVFNALVGWLLDLLFGEGSGKKAAQILEASLNVFMAALNWLVSAVLDFIFSTNNADAKFIELQLWSKELVGLWWDVLSFVFETSNPQKAMEILMNFIIDPWVVSAIDWLRAGGAEIDKAFWSGVKGMLGFAEGGVVPGPKGQAQMAIVHGGETITPEGKGGNNTFNFYGYQDDKFIAKVRDVMRGDATRYSQ
jgi:hypothetical protein